MKPYVIQWIPVEGEVKEGNFVFDYDINGDGTYKVALVRKLNGYNEHNRGLSLISLDGKERWFTAFNNRTQSYTPIVKVELFLCSRDLQAGDKVYGTILSGDNIYVSDKKGYDVNDNIHHISLEEAQIMDGYKLIGKVSPDAVWVKEGMEFDEKDVKIIWWSIKHNCETYAPRPKSLSKHTKEQRVKFRCPSSPNHFH